MNTSKIEWTDKTWNPVTGCTKVSQGCKNCYAEKMYERFNGKGTFKNVICHEDRLEQPLHWKKPSKIFVNSMSDLFHEDVSDDFIDQVFSVMEMCPQHTFQVLTKRPERMMKYFSKLELRASFIQSVTFFLRKKFTLPLPNVWLGISCEDQKTADERIPLLLKTPAAIRFLSCEPLLGPILLQLSQMNNQLNWVIVGGESGPHARPMHPGWVRRLREQCALSQVPFFFKQWGEWFPMFSDTVPLIKKDGIYADSDNRILKGRILQFQGEKGKIIMGRVGKKKAGHLLDGKEYLEFPKTNK